jgi:excisionase family DNA binding protein
MPETANSVTIREAAGLLGVSRTKVWYMVRRGELPAYPDPLDRRQRLVPVESLRAILEQRGGPIGRADVSKGTMEKVAGSKPAFTSDGIASNPDAVPSSEIKDWVRRTWHKQR